MKCGTMYDSGLVKMQFSRMRDIHISKKTINSENPHAEEAERRSAAKARFDWVIATTARGSYDFQTCSSGLHRDGRAFREAFWVKDLHLGTKNDPILPNDIVKMIDVDFYMEDMEHFLANLNGQPVLMYTILPERAARTEAKLRTWFDEQGQYHMHMNGENYVHKLWNWSVGSLVTVRTFCGIIVGVTMWRVERRYVGMDHGVVALLPEARWGVLTAWLALRVFSGERLRRFDPRISNNVIAFKVETGNGTFLTAGRVGGDSSCWIPTRDAETAELGSKASKQAYTIGQVDSWLDAVDRKHARAEAAYLHNYIMSTGRVESSVLAPLPDTTYVPLRSVDSYKPSMTSFMKPLDPNGYSPGVCHANLEVGVQERVVKLQEVKCYRAPTGVVVRAAAYFTKRLASEIGELKSWSCDEVLEHQNTAAKRSRMASWLSEGGRVVNRVTSFMKREAYDSLKDPRIISQFSTDAKAGYAKYILPLGEALKKFAWYGFHVPIQIAIRVAMVASVAMWIIETDYSRWDGRHDRILRELIELPLLLLLFPRETEDVEHIYWVNCNRRVTAQTEEGTTRISYDSGDSRLSGSMETSVFNTLCNRFITFYAWVLYFEEYNYELPRFEAAWSMASLHGGDDGIIAIPLWVNLDKFNDCLDRAVTECGHEIKAKVVPRGTPFTFLARYFNAWNRDELNSCCDVKRQMAKLHLTPSSLVHVTPLDKLREKCRAFLLTDRNTPIIGDFCKYVEGRYSEFTGTIDSTSYWWGQYGVEEQFPNEPMEWYADVVNAHYSEFDQDLLRKAIQESVDPLNFPECVEKKPLVNTQSEPLYVDGEVILPTISSDVASSSANPPPGRKAKQEKRKPQGGRSPRVPPAPSDDQKGARRAAKPAAARRTQRKSIKTTS